jgi:hypothetical protein
MEIRAFAEGGRTDTPSLLVMTMAYIPHEK